MHASTGAEAWSTLCPTTHHLIEHHNNTHVPIFDGAELGVSFFAVAEPVHGGLRALAELAAYYVQIRQALPLHLSAQLQRCVGEEKRRRRRRKVRGVG